MEKTSKMSKKSKRPTRFELSNSCDPSEDSRSVKGAMSGKRMKKDDSGINVIQESESSDENSECSASAGHKLCSSNTENTSEPGSPDSGNLEVSSLNELEQPDNNEINHLDESEDKDTLSHHLAAPIVKNKDTDTPSTSENNAEADNTSESRHRSLSSSPSNVESDDELENVEQKNGDDSKYDPTPLGPKPKHTWNAPISFINRQYGHSSNYSPNLFRSDCYGSLHMVERLELMYKMKKHDGCVNALNFNANGTRLVSGSDDLSIIIWDWTISEPLIEYRSGHRSNIFQAKFMPLSGDSYIVSCARDGQVRIGELSSEGVCRATRKVAQHKGAAHKLAVQFDSPHTFLSCGEDAAVFGIDLRKEKAEKLVICKESEKKVPLYSIFINPHKSYEYIVSGRNQYVKVYDTRFLSQADGFLKQYCPLHLVENDIKANVTSVAYNYNGQEILASYNDEDIYIFDSNETETSKYLHRYKGHRNSQTVKGVSYFGPKSEFVVSGSDCGYIFFWDKNTEHVVNYMHGDEGGVVNCLEPNPNMPVLASSGLDDDIKIWVPSCEEPPNLSGLRIHLTENMKERDEDRRRDCPDEFVDQTIWFLMQYLTRTRRRRIWHGTDEIEGPASSNSSSSESDAPDEDGEQPIQCNQF